MFHQQSCLFAIASGISEMPDITSSNLNEVVILSSSVNVHGPCEVTPNPESNSEQDLAQPVLPTPQSNCFPCYKL